MSDPAMLGPARYERQPDDFYETPAWCTEALLEHLELLPGARIWEPACGGRAISRVLAREFSVFDSDIHMEPSGKVDFVGSHAQTIAERERIEAIITNPPYKHAEVFVRRAIDLMKPCNGLVAMLLRHEWDCAKTRADLFDHPAFAMKITLRRRPVWFPEHKKASPRHNFAWFVWDWGWEAIHPIERGGPDLRYAG